MDISVSIGDESLSINIENPFRFDLKSVLTEITDFGYKSDIDLTQFEIDNLIPRMIRGVAGCEGGCPSDAKSLVREGFGKFNLSYIEGGILTASHTIENGKILQIKIFPEFD